MSKKKYSISNIPTLRRHRRSATGKPGKTIIKRTRIYYSRPSFLDGLARAFDIGGTLGPRIEVTYERGGSGKTEAELDAEEIKAIWAEVGQCMRQAMGHRPESAEAQRPQQGEKNK